MNQFIIPINQKKSKAFFPQDAIDKFRFNALTSELKIES